MRVPRVRGALAEGSEAEYGLYNAQHGSWLDQAVELLTRGGGPRVLVLAGENGIGRSYFCDALRFRLGNDHGEVPAVWHLDLEGFEPESEDPLGRYLLYLLEDEERRIEKQRKKTYDALQTLARTLSQVDWSAAILSCLWQFEDPLKRFGEMLAAPAQDHAGAERSEREMLQMLLDELTRDHKLLLHVTESTQIRRDYRRWLTTQAMRNPNLALAVSCRPEDANDQLVTMDLLPEDPLRFDFKLADGGWASQALARGFAADSCASIEELIDGMPRLGRQLREFLIMAALCRRNVPAELLLAKLELSEDEADELTDVIDDHLVDELGLLWDLGQRHPAFPDLFVYQFCNPIMPGVILDQVTEVDREMEAASLLPFLRDRLPVRRREVARLFLALADHLGERERKVYLRPLEWWIGTDEAEQLKPMVQAEIESGELEPELVWGFVNAGVDWPAYRRLALLDAYVDARDSEDWEHVVSSERALQVRLMRGHLLFALGRFAESSSEAEVFLQSVEPRTVEECQGLLLAGSSLGELGEYATSSQHLIRALSRCRELLGSHHMLTVSAMSALARTLHHQGELGASRDLQEEVLEMLSGILGEDHPDTLKWISSLAED